MNEFKQEQPALEKDLERLSKEVERHGPEVMEDEAAGKEAVKAVLGERIKQQQSVVAPQKQDDVLPQYMSGESPEIQAKVKELIGVVFDRGIDDSISEAKKYGPFILDALHDALTTKLYDELKARGKLK